MAALSLSVFTATAGAAFPGPNGRIAFASDRDGGSYKIFTSAADGTDVLQLTPTGSGINTAPHFSPDGKKIVYSNSASGHLQVFVMNADGTAPTNVTQSATNDQSGSWSPDGTKIVFSRADSNFNAGLVTMNADGSGQTELTTKPSGGFGFGDFRPAWSPDGNTIAFTRYVSGAMSQIYTISPAGGTATNVTNSASSEEDATWSPDSQQLVFDRKIPADNFGNRDVFKMPAGGSATPTNMTNNVADEANPAFSPDGNTLIFSSNRDPGGNNDLYTANADGTSASPTLITTGTPTTTDSQPDWGRAIHVHGQPGIAWSISRLENGTESFPIDHIQNGVVAILTFSCTDDVTVSPTTPAADCHATQAGHDIPNGGAVDTVCASTAPVCDNKLIHFTAVSHDPAFTGQADDAYGISQATGTGLGQDGQSSIAGLPAATNASAAIKQGGLPIDLTSNGAALTGGQASGTPVLATGSGSVLATGSGSVIAAGSGNVIASGSGNVIAAGSGNVIAAGAGNVIAAGAHNKLVAPRIDVLAPDALTAAKKKRKPKPVLLMSVGHTFDQAGTVHLKLKLTKAGRNLLKQYEAAVRRQRKAHKKIPKATISITYVFAARNGNGHGKPPAIFVTRKLRLKP
jgi:TolB protein